MGDQRWNRWERGREGDRFLFFFFPSFSLFFFILFRDANLLPFR